MKKNEVTTLPNAIYKINSKWSRDLNVSPDSIKLSEENTGRTFFDINHSKIFFDPPLKSKENKNRN